MNNINLKKEKTQNQKRIGRIIFFYHFYLFNWNLDLAIDYSLQIDKGYDFDDEEYDFFIYFKENILKIEDSIKKNITNKWSFERIEPFVKAVMIESYIECKFFKVDKKIIINEALNILDNYSYDKVKGMTNAILDKII